MDACHVQTTTALLELLVISLAASVEKSRVKCVSEKSKEEPNRQDLGQIYKIHHSVALFLDYMSFFCLSNPPFWANFYHYFCF